MNTYHNLEQWLSWMDQLSSSDFVVIDHFIRHDILHDVTTLFNTNLSSFTKAGIGAFSDHTILNEIRGDYTHWLDRKRDTVIHSFWSLVDETIHIFNRYCYLSLSGYEFHFAQYPPGSKYEKHLDQFNNRSNRMISVIIYLNKDWKKGDGGELEIYLKEGGSVLVEPVEARCVMFKSADVPHRVIQSNKDRYSLTGWLLHQPGGLGRFID